LVAFTGNALFFKKKPYTGPTWTVKKEKLKVAIVERGSLESARNGDIVCTVRARTQGSTVASTIKWIIDAGVEVQKGDKLVELDSSGLVEALKDKNITVDEKKAIWVQADEEYRITASLNDSEIAKAQNELDLARIDLEKYKLGDYVQSLKDIEGRLETSLSDLENWRDRSAWSQRMAKKGLVSKIQADADLARVDGARIAMEKIQEEKRVLVNYTKKRTEQDLNAKLLEAERALERKKNEARAKLAQKDADRLSKESTYKQELTRKQEIEAEIAKCIILAPQDGLVVYYVPEQVRGGGGSQQSIVAQGEPVREGQKLMQIPDLSRMLVNVRVHEAMVSHLRNEDPNDSGAWQQAQIRVDADPSRILRGHVKSVDTIASQQDFFAADVKVYKTMVSIDEPVEGLKPGMSAEVTIIADESPNEVLSVPIQSVVGTISSGAKRQCFVLDEDDQPQLREIVVGMSNQRSVEVKSGIKEGERVVLNPMPLLPEDTELKPGKSRSKSDAVDDDDDTPKKKGGKKKGGPPASGPGGIPGKGLTPGGPVAPPNAKGPETAPMPAVSKEKMAEWAEKLRTASPAERRQMIDRIPDPASRERALQKLREQGLDVGS
jgi:HlyD family secretion protein